jgi:hypothetical protein
MSRYEQGRAYRDNLGSRKTQTSTPTAVEAPTFPVTHHGTRPMNHVETVGHVPGGGFKEATHPNASVKTGTDRFYQPPGVTAPHGTLNREHMKSKS